MGSLAMALPVVDLGGGGGGGVHEDDRHSSWRKACSEVRSALEEHGVVFFKYDQKIISPELMDEMFEKMKSLFDLPLEAKSRNASPDPFFTFAAGNPDNPLHQCLSVLDVASPESVSSFTRRMWPQGNQAFSETAQEMSKKMLELGRLIMKMIYVSYGVAEEDGKILEANTVFRMTKYSPPSPEAEKPATGLTAHADSNSLTIICHNGVDGLQFKTRDGDWVQVPHHPTSTFIVFAGYSLQAWSNGRISAPKHKVEMNGSKARYSLGLFLMPEREQEVEAPPELIDADHPRLYRPFTYFDFLDFAGAHNRGENVLDKHYSAAV